MTSNEWVAMIWLLGAIIWGGPTFIVNAAAGNKGMAAMSAGMCVVYTFVAVFYLVGE